MVVVQDKKECCGCSACANICSHAAISMKADNTGFCYPYVQTDACTNCGLCEMVCPMQTMQEPREPLHTYGVKNRDEEVRLSSSSGGLFSVLAEQTINDGGIVYGALFNEKWAVVHGAVKKKEDIRLFRGSKYVQSDIGHTYKDIKKNLKNGIKVLFCGTPCQVAALKHFLNKEDENLTTIDFVCHGVPTPKIWAEYLDEVISAHKANLNRKKHLSPKDIAVRIEDISFRNKSNGWKQFRFSMKIVEEVQGKKSSSVLSSDMWDNTYMRLFLGNYILRPSCHHCKFRCSRSGSDYTMGDYWGIQEVVPGLDDDKGISLLMEYHKKDGLTEAVNAHCDLIETSFESAIKGNSAIIKDWPKDEMASLFNFLHHVLKIKIEKSLRICQRMKKELKRFRLLS